MREIPGLNPIPRIWMTVGGGVERFVLHQVCRHFSAASEGSRQGAMLHDDNIRWPQNGQIMSARAENRKTQ